MGFDSFLKTKSFKYSNKKIKFFKTGELMMFNIKLILFNALK